MRLKSKRLLLLGLSLVVSLLTILGWPLVSIGSAPTGSAPTRSIATEPSISQPQQTQSLLEQGLSQYEAEQFAAAIQSWQQALVTLPHSSWQQGWIWNSLALAYQQLGRWDEAEAAVQQGLAALTDLETADPKAAAAPRAKLLNTQGRWHWYRNQPEQALQSWQQAALAYQQADDRTGLTISLINQARAFQSLGFSSRAETLLEQVENLQHQEADPALKATGLRDLGNALRRIGKLQDSRELLQSSLEVSSQVQASERAGAEAAIYLDLGNTERALGYKAVAIGDRATAQIQFQQALATYQQAVQASERSAPLTAPLAALQAQLNQFSLLIELNRRSEALAMTTLRTDLEALPATRTSLYARLNYAHSMAKAVAQDSVTPDQPVLKDLARFLAQTGEQAKALGDRRAESYALGELGELYERAGQWGEAETLTQQALLQAEALQAADVRYRWEWQLGRLLKQQGNQSAALAAYQAAVESLQSVRNDLLSVSDEVQFSFRDDVEPVYRGLVELLLTDGGPNPAVSQANLKQAIQQINALQLAELNNFLGCNLAQIVELDDVTADATAAKLYPMLLPNQLAVVLERQGNQPLLIHQVLKPRAELLAMLQQLRRDLSAPDRTPEAVAGLGQLHQWLIAPFQAQLDSSIKTLVFVLDAELRNVPMAALYDAQQADYLISRYAVAVAPRLELFQPSPRPAQLNLFLGGVGEPQTLDDRSFPRIEYLTPELEQIQTLVQAKTPLLNADFTEANLEQQLQQGDFSVVHLKTHGIFSSDPEASFIVAYRELITGRDLGRLIQLGKTDRRLGESALELLVLSACSTAQGDNRAVLGLAGVAVQAGARSVVSTLWEAQDRPNTELMVRFYQTLLDPQVSRAEALRQAQLHLLAQGYTTPHIWATYVLVGNWL